jgi:tripartite-type tricarboxylate transporter receptor subunit TctC
MMIRLPFVMTVALCTMCVAHADYPTKPIRMIVPLAAGGAMDTVARAVAVKLTDRLKQTVVVDNRSGAAGSIGAELTAHAVPDGYTILMASASYVTHTLMYRAPYDPVRDFAPVTQATAQPYVIVVNPTVPARTIAEFVALAKAKPGTLNYGSSGSGSFIHLCGELFSAMTKTQLVHIPYKGIAAAYPDLIGGQIQFTFGSSISAMPHIKTGRLRPLAVTSRNRAKSLPDLPTISETVAPGFDVTQWYGVLGPRGLPQPIIDKLQREFTAVLRDPDTIAKLAADGSEPAPSSPAEFAAHIKNERDKWAKVIKQAGIRGE